jgi:hypothetical protein
VSIEDKIKDVITHLRQATILAEDARRCALAGQPYMIWLITADKNALQASVLMEEIEELAKQESKRLRAQTP